MSAGISGESDLWISGADCVECADAENMMFLWYFKTENEGGIVGLSHYRIERPPKLQRLATTRLKTKHDLNSKTSSGGRRVSL